MIHCADMFPAVDTRDLAAVQSEVEAIFSSLYPEADGGFISRAFASADEWFGGHGGEVYRSPP